MNDLENARTGGGNRRGQLGDATRTVDNTGPEPPQPPIDRQAVIDDPSERRHVDVAATEKEHDPLAAEVGQFVAERRCQSRCRRSLDDRLLQFGEPQNGQRQ